VLALLETANRALREQLDSLLDLSRLDAGVIQPNPEVFRLDQVVELHARHIAPLAAAQGLGLVVACGAPVSVESDAGLLMRLLGNLTSNALKFTPTGHLALRVVPTGNEVHIVVEDTGPGIPEEQQATIFEEFVQLNNAQQDVTRGLGLGLAIVKRLCQLLNADIRLSSAPGRGSRFVIALPLVAPVDAAAPAAACPVLGVADIARQKLVLAGALSPSLQGTRTLLEAAGHPVVVVSDARLALVHIRSGQAQVLIAEVRLAGGIQGPELMAQALREAPGLRAALLMGDTASERIPSLRALGVAVFFKPVVPRDLLDWLAQMPGA
jgi:two-component sensor histidine kinase/CheY-like chemotaxis protein